MATPGLECPYEASDEASECELLERSLSVWRGRGSVDGGDEFAPIRLDLHTASSIGQFDSVRTIIQRQEEDLNGKNRGGWTALMYASYIGHDNVVNLLLDAGVHVNVKNNKGQTPLMLAASCGNESVAYFLLQQGAELEARDRKGWTALFHATYSGHQNMVKFLLEAHADMEAREPVKRYTPFMIASQEGHEIIVQYFLQHGVTVDVKACSGDNARTLALIHGHMKIVSLIDNHALGVTAAPRTDPGLRMAEDLSSSDEAVHKPRRHVNTKPGRKSSRGPSIRDGPDAFAKIMVRDKNQSGGHAASDPTLGSYVPKGYVTFKSDNVPTSDASQIRSRDVTSPINPEDHTGSLDSSGSREFQEYDDDSNAFSKTGALTIKSSSSSSGGLIAALGISQHSTDEDNTHSDPGTRSRSPTAQTQGQTSSPKPVGKDEAAETSSIATSDVQRQNTPTARVPPLTPPQPTQPHITTPTQPHITTPTSAHITTHLQPHMSTHLQPHMSTQTQPHMSTQTQPHMSTQTQPHMSTQTQPHMSTQTQPHMSTQTQPHITTPTSGHTHQVPMSHPVSAMAGGERYRGACPLGGALVMGAGPGASLPPIGQVQSRPQDLATLLGELGLLKYQVVFEEQDVDLPVFLSLTDNDLKEIGIGKFGPRRKMTNAIARWHSNASLGGSHLEQAYADKLEAGMQEMAIQLNQAYEHVEQLKGQVRQERELRSVAESCLMHVDDQTSWQHVHLLASDIRHRCVEVQDSIKTMRCYSDELSSRLKPDVTHHDDNSLVKAIHEGLSLDEPVQGSTNQLAGLTVDQLIQHGRALLDDMWTTVTITALNTDKLLVKNVDFTKVREGFS